MFKPLIKLIDKHGIVSILNEIIRYINDNKYSENHSATRIVIDLQSAIRNYEASDNITDVLVRLDNIESRLVTLELNSNEHERRIDVVEDRSHRHEERDDF